MDENELEVMLEKEEVVFEDRDEDLNGNEQGILNSLLEDFTTHEGTDRLVSNYKVILRVLEDPSKVDSHTLKTALNVISEGLSVSREDINSVGEDVTKLTREQWKSARKSSLTLLFLFFKAVTNIESKFFAEQQNLSVVAAVQGTKKRGKKNATAENTSYPFWDEYRQKLMLQMNRMLKCPVEKLWPDATNFFRGVTLAVCTVIQNPAAKLIKNLDLVDYLFDVLGQLCARYEEQPGVINRIVPMITNSEDTAKVIAHGLNRLHVNYERDRVIFTAVKEVLQQYNTSLGRETPADRSVATFLQEIAVVNPKACVTALPFIVQFLESESSTIRGAVLGVCSELLTWSKTPEEANNGAAENGEGEVSGHDFDLDALRDDVLHYLLLHCRDTNALVRNKALQLCTKLTQQSSLYISEVVQVAEQGKRRLMDKAVTTRKFAINLLSAAVYIDPLVIKFSVPEFKEQIRKLREELMESISKDLPLPKKILVVLKEFMELVRGDILGPLKLPDDVKEPEAALEHVKRLLETGSVYEAAKFLYAAFQEFMQHPDFKPYAKEMNSKKMYVTMFKKLLDIDIVDPEDEEEDGVIEDAAVVESEQSKQKRHYIKYMENCRDLAAVMESALPSMTILLELGNAADKTEVIECFAILTESGYNLDTRVMGGIIDAIGQLDSQSKAEMLEHFCRIFLKGCNSDDRVVRRLFEMLDQLEGTQREHMASVIQEMVNTKHLVQDHFQVLWDAYGLTNPAWKAEDSKYAALIISLVGKTHVSVITANIAYLMDVGLGPRGLEDYHLTQYTLEALMLLCPKPPKNPEEDTETLPAMRFAVDHILYEKLSEIIVHGLSKISTISVDHAFQKVSEVVFQLIYRTCMEPKKIILNLLGKVHGLVFGAPKQNSEIANKERMLCRYLNIVTALLGAHVFYYENVVLSEVKKRRKIATTKKESKSSKKTSKANSSKSVSRSRNATLNSTTSSQRSNTSTPGNTSEVSEMDVIIGTIGYDAELETVRGYLEKILLEPGAFKQMRTHTIFVCTHLDKFQSLHLKIGAVRALAKIMSISNVSVARNAEILLGLWKMVKSPEVKCEILRAAVLLNVRYPNQMERCNSYFLEGLQDDKDCIRIATLDFITFLALNDLVKIREQFTEVALCVIDKNVDVKEMAKDFLKQCGEKDNMLSNALPDILSRLSTRPDFPQESFQEIMKYLLEIVKKDKVLVGFVEKLILRFRVASKGRECQDVAFCLNQLTYNDKSFKVIKENLTAFQDKLGDEYVFDAFNTIVANLKKTAKPDFKSKLDEFESDIVAARAKCIEKERMEEAAVRKAVAGAPPESSSDSEVEADDEEKEAEANQEAAAAAADDSDKENDEDQNPIGSEETEESETEEAPSPAPTRSTRAASGRNTSRRVPTSPKKPRGRAGANTSRRVKAEPKSRIENSSSSSEAEEEEEKEPETTKAKGRSTRGRAARAKVEASSSDED